MALVKVTGAIRYVETSHHQRRVVSMMIDNTQEPLRMTSRGLITTTIDPKTELCLSPRLANVSKSIDMS
jgi:hypothetical protein